MEIKIHDQAQAVKKALKEEKMFPDEFEELYLPGLDSFFGYSSIKFLPVKEKQFKVEKIVDQKYSRDKVVDLVLGYIVASPLTAGIKWDFTTNQLVLLQSSDTVINTNDEKFIQDLKELISIILKSRIIVNGIDWRFGEEFVTVKIV